jgi:hypothetical protein
MHGLKIAINAVADHCFTNMNQPDFESLAGIVEMTSSAVRIQ